MSHFSVRCLICTDENLYDVWYHISNLEKQARKYLIPGGSTTILKEGKKLKSRVLGQHLRQPIAMHLYRLGSGKLKWVNFYSMYFNGVKQGYLFLLLIKHFQIKSLPI